MCKVSIITPCYNSSEFIEQTINSVRSQTFKDWEHIIVDDASTDDSGAKVSAYLKIEPRLRFMQQPHGGVSAARNKGFKIASKKSTYLLFLDADDCLKPSMLQVMVAYLDEHPEVGLAYCKHRCIDGNGNLLPLNFKTGFRSRYAPTRFWLREVSDFDPETPFESIFSLAGIVLSLSLIRRKIYEQTTGFDEDFGQLFEDTDLILNIALVSEVHYIDQPLVLYRKHSKQSTSDIDKLDRQERKLYLKWNKRAWPSSSQKEIIEKAYRFNQGRVIPYIGIKAGNRYLKEKEFKKAARFYIGAIKRYIINFYLG